MWTLVDSGNAIHTAQACGKQRKQGTTNRTGCHPTQADSCTVALLWASSQVPPWAMVGRPGGSPQYGGWGRVASPILPGHRNSVNKSMCTLLGTIFVGKYSKWLLNGCVFCM